jgi:hypothetical protein
MPWMSRRSCGRCRFQVAISVHLELFQRGNAKRYVHQVYAMIKKLFYYFEVIIPWEMP